MIKVIVTNLLSGHAGKEDYITEADWQGNAFWVPVAFLREPRGILVAKHTLVAL